MLKWLKSLPGARRSEDAPKLLADAATCVCRFEFDAAEQLCRRVLAASRIDGNEAVAARALELLKAIKHNRTSYIYTQVYKLQPRQDAVSSPSARLRGLAAASWLWLRHPRQAVRGTSGSAAWAAIGQYRVRFERGRMVFAGSVAEHCQVIYAFANELLFASVRTVPRRSHWRGRKRRFQFHIGRGLALFPPDEAVRITLSTGTDIILHERVDPAYALSWPKGTGGIEDKIRSGAILTAHGTIGAAPLHSTVDRWLDTYEALAGFMTAKWNMPIFLFYGTLLGAVRDQAIIPFDDDFDAAYFSNKSTATEVREEMIEIASSLVASNSQIQVRLMTFFFKVNLNGGAIDVFPTWHDGEYLWSPWATRLRCGRNLLGELKDIEFLGRRVQVPVRAETFLEMKYGPTWRRPDPAYRRQPQPDVDFPFRAMTFDENDCGRIVERARQLAGSDRVGTVKLRK